MRRPVRLLTLSAIATLVVGPLAATAQEQHTEPPPQERVVPAQPEGAAPPEGPAPPEGAVPPEGAAQPEGDEPTATEAPDTRPPLYDLGRLLRASERGYPGVRAADARIRAARAQLDEAWVTPYFQSVITAGFTLAPEARGSPIFSPDAQVPLSNPWQPVLGFNFEGAIPLWTFGKLGAARDAARAGIRAAESDRSRVRAQLLFDVRRAYFALQLALDVQQMLSEGIPRLEEAIERTEDRLAAGDPEVDDMDRYKLQAALAEVRGREAQAVHLEASSRSALQILSGVRTFRVPECPIQVVDARLRPLRVYVSSAMSDRPEVRMLEAAQRAREAALDFSRAGFWPDLALTYRFTISYAPGITDQTNPFIIDPANYMNIGAGIALRWSLDFWGNAYRVDRDSALLDDVRERFDEARRGMELEITDAYNTVVEARTRQEAYDRGRRATRSWFITAAQSVELGTAETSDLVDAVSAYFTARYSHLQAIHDFNSSLANLERVSAMPVTERWEEACD